MAFPLMGRSGGGGVVTHLEEDEERRGEGWGGEIWQVRSRGRSLPDEIETQLVAKT